MPPTASPPPAAPALTSLRQLLAWVVWGMLGTGVGLAGVLLLVNRGEWWRGYMAATLAAVFAAVASLVPLAFGVRRGGAMLVQMFMASSGIRAAVALGLCALAVGVGRFPTLPTFALVIPYYLTLLVVETACLTRAARPAS